MKIKGLNRCIACMRLLGEEGTCAYCHFQQEGYQPIPRCLRPGTELAKRYCLGRVLGEGSFGITYIAWDTLLDTAVAIKEYFPSNLASRHVGDGNDFNVYIYEKTETKNYRNNLQKYLDEAKSLSAFSDLDGIVSVRDFFYENQTAYIVMSYVEGVSVKEYVEKNGRIEGTLFLNMLEPILSSLAKVHETGVLHRDISPDNILITRENKMVLIDFGAARKENISMTRSMTVVFKQGYSPEEQYRTHGKQGAWSDIYALCATAYYALTGTRPDEAIERVLEDEMQSLEDMPDICLSDFQKKSFMKGIAVRPTERYQTVESLYQDLYLQQDDRKRSGIFRYRLPLLFAAFLLIAVCALGVWKWKSREPLPVEQRKTAETVSGQAVQDLYDTVTEPPLREMISCEGLKRTQAEQMLAGEEWQILWKESYSDTVKKGVVMQQSIAAGTKYYEGEYTQLTLTVSKGVKKITVPSVEGMSRQKAVKLLKSKQFKVTVKQKQSSQTAKGIVMSQSIAEGKSVKEGSSLTLTVSSGAPEIAETPKPAARKPRSTQNKKKQTEADFEGVIP